MIAQIGSQILKQQIQIQILIQILIQNQMKIRLIFMVQMICQDLVGQAEFTMTEHHQIMDCNWMILEMM